MAYIKKLLELECFTMWLTTFPNTEKGVENTTRGGAFSTNFEGIPNDPLFAGGVFHRGFHVVAVKKKTFKKWALNLSYRGITLSHKTQAWKTLYKLSSYFEEEMTTTFGEGQLVEIHFC